MDKVLKILKADLGILHDKLDQDELIPRIESAIEDIEREGIKIDMEKISHVVIVVDYAAWLYRKRTQNVPFPHSLRFRMNNLLYSQKGGIQ